MVGLLLSCTSATDVGDRSLLQFLGNASFAARKTFHLVSVVIVDQYLVPVYSLSLYMYM